MKTLQVSMMVALVCLLTSSCAHDESPDASVTAVTTQASPLGRKGANNLRQMALVAARNNAGQGKIMLEPSPDGYSVALFKDLVLDCVTIPGVCLIVDGKACFVSGNYGRGDFWRQNPNGSVSAKLTTNEAFVEYLDVGTGDYYTGTGHMNTKFTGDLFTFCDGGVCINFLSENPNANAWVVQGHSNVTLNGAGGQSRRLQFQQVTNPSGRFTVDFGLN